MEHERTHAEVLVKIRIFVPLEDVDDISELEAAAEGSAVAEGYDYEVNSGETEVLDFIDN